MSVYHKERAEYLRAAMDSIWEQTVQTDDFVLVCDGPLTAELDAVIDEMETAHPELHVVRLAENGGLGRALNFGIKYCRNELIARMDSDDISRSDRCERQLAAFCSDSGTSLCSDLRISICSDSGISICSGTVEEFTVSPQQVQSRRVLPETHEQIAVFAQNRNPFNHPCVMYRKSAVENVGGYRDFYLLEDYDLWVRMLQNGARGCNIQEPLLWMRAGSELYRRRAGFKYAMSQRALFRYMLETGFIGKRQYGKSVAIRFVSALIPNTVREFAYRKILRKNGVK